MWRVKGKIQSSEVLFLVFHLKNFPSKKHLRVVGCVPIVAYSFNCQKSCTFKVSRAKSSYQLTKGPPKITANECMSHGSLRWRTMDTKYIYLYTHRDTCTDKSLSKFTEGAMFINCIIQSKINKSLDYCLRRMQFK